MIRFTEESYVGLANNTRVNYSFEGGSEEIKGKTDVEENKNNSSSKMSCNKSTGTTCECNW